MFFSARVTNIETLDAREGGQSNSAAVAGSSSPVPGESSNAAVATATASSDPPRNPENPAEAGSGEPTTEELVNRAVIHTDKPIEHLPFIAPPELKLIGRCVTFKGDSTVDGQTRSFYYEGLVGTINKETVMLIHVRRYTEEDFQLHKLQLRHPVSTSSEKQKTVASDNETELNIADGSMAGAEATGGAASAAHAAGGGTAGNSREEQEANRESVGANDTVSEAAGGAAPQEPNGTDFDFDPSAAVMKQQLVEPQVLNDFGETHIEETTRVRNRMRGHEGSMGPIPYVTFSRMHIHRVEFGVDPRSSFYSLFHDPTKHYFDMQCLRMFVRRYIIHTSQGNNPRLVPLRAFITCRCNCPDLDNELLINTTREELAHLIKIDRDVKRAKKKKEQGRRHVLRAYRAPEGLFRLTGVLYLTHLPRQTFTIGVMEIIVTLLLLVYEVMSSVSTETTVMAIYMLKLYPYMFATVIAGVVATMCTVFHAVKMSIPVHNQMYLVAGRALFTLSTVACSIMAMIVAGEMAGTRRWTNFYTRELSQVRLCAFYASQRCSGITESCADSPSNSTMCQCAGYTSPSEYFPVPCGPIMFVYLQRTLVPLLCMTFLVFVTYLFDGYLHLRLFHVARLLERRM